ncbi:MAG: hypothetical protein ACE5EH_12580, partial [Gammaproteobacteria bacterium]
MSFCKIFKGFGDRKYKDTPAAYWLAFIIGFLEMLSYPALIVTNNPEIIGGWLVFKTVYRWEYTKNKSRGLFNR